MKRQLLLTTLFCCVSALLSAQNEYTDYRSATNPFYWKNRKPYEGYWQQDVHYNIKAEINDSTDILTGEEELIYWNNSPITTPRLVQISGGLGKPHIWNDCPS